jgi:hypothetical protein
VNARAQAAATALALAAFLLPATQASAERLVTTLSTSRVLIASNFTGADVVLFGSVERDAQTVARRGGYDIVVTVTGPRSARSASSASGSIRRSALSSRRHLT